MTDDTTNPRPSDASAPPRYRNADAPFIVFELWPPTASPAA
jgi:hypothetical protein